MDALFWLEAEYNDIDDISDLEDLEDLNILNLEGNQIGDVSPLVDNAGMGSGDTVNLEGNPLSTTSCNTHIPALKVRGVSITDDCP